MSRSRFGWYQLSPSTKKAGWKRNVYSSRLSRTQWSGNLSWEELKKCSLSSVNEQRHQAELEEAEKEVRPGAMSDLWVENPTEASSLMSLPRQSAFCLTLPTGLRTGCLQSGASSSCSFRAISTTTEGNNIKRRIHNEATAWNRTCLPRGFWLGEITQYP